MIETLEPTTILFFFIIVLSSIWICSGPKNLPPGPARWPLIGNLPVFVKHQKRLGEYFGELKDTYGPLISFNVLGGHIIVLNDYDLIKEAFVKKSAYFGHRPDGCNTNKVLFKSNRGVISSHGPIWSKSRRFTLQILRDLGVGKNTIESTIQDETSSLQEELASYAGQPRNIKGLLLHAVSNIMGSVIFGKRTDYSDAEFRSMVENLNKSLNEISNVHPADLIPGCLELFPAGRFILQAYGKMEAFIDEQIKAHSDTYDPNETRDFIDVYLHCERENSGKENEHLTRENLKMIIRDLFVAGSDTTSCTIYWILLYIIAHPEVQKKCKEEIMKVIGDSKNVKYSDRKDLHYVEATLAEIQRLSTIGPLGVPHKVSNETTLNGYTIPKGAIVISNLLQVHYDKEIWGDDADKMRPERWLNEKGEFVKNEKFIPFSIGSRVCLGEQLAKMQTFIVFVGLLQHFTFTKESSDLNLDLTGFSGSVRLPKDYNICAKI